MAHITYDFYTNKYKGTLSDDIFNRLCGRAHAVLCRVTFNRAEKIDSYPEAVRQKIMLAECAVLDELSALEDMPEPGVSSRTVGRESVSYEASATSESARLQRCAYAASLYLSGTGLMYRGVHL